MSWQGGIVPGVLVGMAALVAGLHGCGASPSGPGSDWGSGSGSGGSSGGAGQSSSSGSSGSQSTGGDDAGGSTSSSGGQSSGGGFDGGSGGGSDGSGSGSSLDGGSSGDGGPVAPTRGCGQATSCTPGNDLAPPASADGFQIVLPPNSVSISPGEEAYYCYYKVVPGNAAINVGAFQSWMSTGSSHHFITFTGSGTDGNLTGGPVGGAACNPSGNWVYATSTPGKIIELKMPDGVGLPMPAGQILILNMHFINPTSAAISPEVKLNVLYTKNLQYTAESMVSFNAGIYVPAGGTQTVTGYCAPPAGSKFFAYTTHSHKYTTSVKVNYVSGGQTMAIADTTDYESPDVALWNGPFLTTKSGDQFTYSCSYANTTASPVTVGETAATNEMCMSIGYFFPATSTTSGIGSSYCH